MQWLVKYVLYMLVYDNKPFEGGKTALLEWFCLTHVLICVATHVAGQRTGCGTMSGCSRYHITNTSVDGENSLRLSCFAEQRLGINIEVSSNYVYVFNKNNKKL